MDGWVGEVTDEWTDGETGGQIGMMDGRTTGWLDRGM